MRKICLLSILLGVIFLTGCTMKKESDVKVYQIGFTTAPKEIDPYYIFAKNFSDIVSKKSEGKIRIDIKGSGQLGQEGEMFTGMQIGTTDMAIMTNAYVSGYIPQAGIFDFPFIFKNEEQAAEILDGTLGQDVLNEYEHYGIKALAYGEGGFRHLVTINKAVREPKDFKGLKIRCMETETYISTYQELGTNAVPMAWAETITGLQQGTIDGLDVPISVAYANGFVDVAHDLNLTGHFYSPLILCVSNYVYKDMTTEQQKILQEAAVEAGRLCRQSNQKLESGMLKEMENQGMQIVRDVDVNAFKEKFAKFYEKRADKVGQDYYQRLMEQIKE